MLEKFGKCLRDGAEAIQLPSSNCYREYTNNTLYSALHSFLASYHAFLMLSRSLASHTTKLVNRPYLGLSRSGKSDIWFPSGPGVPWGEPLQNKCQSVD